MNVRSIQANGIDIAFDDLGSGSPLLLLHGFARDRTVWGPVADDLKDRFRLIVPDFRGMGGTPHPDPDTPITMALLADDFAALLHALDINTAAVAGFSMAGYVLLELLVRHPNKVCAAAFVGTRASEDTQAKKDDRIKQNELIAEEGVAPLAKGYVQKLFSSVFTSANPDILEETYRNFASQDSTNIALLNDAMRMRVDMTPGLGEIRCPCVVIGGGEDLLVAPEAMKALHESLSDSTLDMVEGAGHMLPVETPGRVVLALEGLMKRASM